MAHDTAPLSNAQMRDIEALLHPYTNAVTHRQVGAHLIERGEGVYVYDEQGRRFIEGMAGLWCSGLGFGDKELVEAAKEQLDKLPYYHLFGGRTHEPAIELAEKIKELYPIPMARVHYCSSGSEANDTQVKLIWYMMNGLGKPEKKKIISRKKGYHGVTLVTASLTGLPLNHQSFNLPFDFVKHTTTPHYWREGRDGETEADFVARCAADLEEMILAEGPDTVAAFIAEPVMGAGGVIVPPEGYFPAIAKVLQKYDILFIDDEVICGFGRTGNWFGAETLDMQATSVSMAKQLTASYVPLSAVAINQEMADAIEAESGRHPALGHGHTYGGHPLGCAVGVKTLEIYQRRDILGHVRKVAPLFQAKLRSLAEHPLVGEARGVGLMGALELSPDRAKAAPFKAPGKVGAKLQAELLAHGVIIRSIGDSAAMCPPMILTEDQVEEMFAPMEKCLDAAHAWAKKEGHLG
ncbi:MAG TPA: aminotransferase [Thermohalobaculum sp.]|nr:aminotransferase [Thermohalobaculum sp.]